jgi:post-segregation antitoxin (ccd killing protein)
MNAHIANAAEIIQMLKAQGLSQTTIGDRLGKSQAVVSRWGRGQGAPNRSEYEALLRLCGILPQTLSLPESNDRMKAQKAISSESSLESRPELDDEDPKLLSIQVDDALFELAVELKADVKTLFLTVGMDAVRADVRRLWQKQLEEAILERNAYFEKHGLPLAKFRSI